MSAEQLPPRLQDLYPWREMVKRGWIEGSKDPAVLEEQLRTFLKLEPGQLKPKLLPGFVCGAFGGIRTGADESER